MAAWATRAEELEDHARRLAAAGFDALHFEGQGRIPRRPLPRRGMADGTRGDSGRHRAHGQPAQRGGADDARSRADRGRRPVDPAARAGRRAHRAWAGGGAVRGRQSCRDHGGRGRGDHGGGRRSTRSGALGEVALVDRESRIGQLGTTLDTLLDENAVSHIALGDGDPSLIGEGDRSRNEERDAPRLHDRRRRTSPASSAAAPASPSSAAALAALAESSWKRRRSTGAPSSPTACSWACG